MEESDLDSTGRLDLLCCLLRGKSVSNLGGDDARKRKLRLGGGMFDGLGTLCLMCSTFSIVFLSGPHTWVDDGALTTDERKVRGMLGVLRLSAYALFVRSSRATD